MKTKFLLFSTLIAAATAFSQVKPQSPAPTPATNQSVSAEELNKYVTAMDSVNKLTAAVKDTITAMVNNNKAVSANRYYELSKIIGDEAKLSAANATPDEIAFVKQVVERKDQETAKVNQTFQSLAKDYVGAATFNKVKKALAADAQLKARYDSILSVRDKSRQGIN